MVGVIYNYLDPNKAYRKTVNYPAFMTYLCHKAYNHMRNTFETFDMDWCLKRRFFLQINIDIGICPKNEVMVGLSYSSHNLGLWKI